jgi:hypothetical protein
LLNFKYLQKALLIPSSSVAIRRILLEVFPLIQGYKEDIVGKPIIPRDLPNDDKLDIELNNIVGKGQINIQRYVWSYYKNLLRDPYLNNDNLLEIYSDTIYYITKKLWKRSNRLL